MRCRGRVSGGSNRRVQLSSARRDATSGLLCEGILHYDAGDAAVFHLLATRLFQCDGSILARPTTRIGDCITNRC